MQSKIWVNGAGGISKSRAGLYSRYKKQSAVNLALEYHCKQYVVKIDVDALKVPEHCERCAGCVDGALCVREHAVLHTTAALPS